MTGLSLFGCISIKIPETEILSTENTADSTEDNTTDGTTEPTENPKFNDDKAISAKKESTYNSDGNLNY